MFFSRLGLAAGTVLAGAAAAIKPIIQCHYKHCESGLEGGSYTGIMPVKWCIATEEGFMNVLVYSFDEESEARAAFESLTICCILYNKEGGEIQWSP